MTDQSINIEVYMKELSTKEKILIAAKKLFVAYGFAGTSMSKVAKEAQINHSLIFHHYKNKEQLWVAVKQSIVKKSGEQHKTLPDTNLPFNQFLKDLFMQNMQFYRNNTDVVRMINWQRLEYETSQHIGITLSTETQAWINAFKHYQKKGDIDATLKPEFIITLILSIISSAALDPNIFISNKKNQQAYIQFCMECLMKALGK